MTTHTDSRVIMARPEHLFELVADVESYPHFLPLWRSAKVLRREGETYYTDQEVGLGPVRERFETRTVLTKPHSIEVTSADSMFRDFFIRWDFFPLGSCSRVKIALRWRVQSEKLQRAVDLLLPQAARSMASAFERRAKEARPRVFPDRL